MHFGFPTALSGAAPTMATSLRGLASHERGTSFHPADVNSHLSPLPSATERMQLFFASCIFQDSVSRKKTLLCHGQEGSVQTPTASVAASPLFTSVSYMASEKAKVCIFAKLTSEWRANQLMTSNAKELSELRPSYLLGR